MLNSIICIRWYAPNTNFFFDWLQLLFAESTNVWKYKLTSPYSNLDKNNWWWPKPSGERLMGNFSLHKSCWQHLNPLINLNKTYNQKSFPSWCDATRNTQLHLWSVLAKNLNLYIHLYLATNLQGKEEHAKY